MAVFCRFSIVITALSLTIQQQFAIDCFRDVAITSETVRCHFCSDIVMRTLLSYGLVRSKREYCQNCSLVVVLC